MHLSVGKTVDILLVFLLRKLAVQILFFHLRLDFQHGSDALAFISEKLFLFRRQFAAKGFHVFEVIAAAGRKVEPAGI